MEYWDRVISETLKKRVRNNVRFYTPLHDVNHYSVCNLADTPPACKNKRQQKTYRIYESCSQSYLTQREAECIYLLLQGMTMKAIGKMLSLSPRTIEFYLKRIKTKLDCPTKQDLIDRIKQSKFLDIFHPPAGFDT